MRVRTSHVVQFIECGSEIERHARSHQRFSFCSRVPQYIRDVDAGMGKQLCRGINPFVGLHKGNQGKDSGLPAIPL